MNKLPIKSLLLSFLPLLIFVLADEFLSDHYPEAEATRYALILAISLGIIQGIYIFVTEKRLDKMLLLDTALIILMGGISLVSGNDIFFKLKPALIQAVMVVVLGFMAFVKPELLHGMSGRFMPDRVVPDEQKRVMQRAAQGLVVLFLLHTLLIVYAALHLSKGAWAFISGPLIYILAVLYFVGMVVVGRWRARAS